MRPTALALLLIAFAATVYAQNTYIVPATVTELRGPDRLYRSLTTVINVGQMPVQVTAHTFTTTPISPPCLFGAGPIAPGDFGALLGDMNLYEHCAERIFTLVIESHEPLLVRSRIESVTTGSCLTQNFQEIPVASSWLPAETDAIVPTFEAFPVARANLFITNPNALPITVVFAFQRDPYSTQEMTLDVLPESVRVLRLPDLPDGIPCGISPCPTAYQARLKATGMFLAGISSIFPGGGEVFFPAIPGPAKN